METKKGEPAMKKKPQKKKKQQPALVFPAPIPDTPENIARRCFQAPFKKAWRTHPVKNQDG